MKTSAFIFVIFFMTSIFALFSSQNEEQLAATQKKEPVIIKGFFIGMTQAQVQEVYKKLLSDSIAKHISLESEDELYIIMLDNEFSSMGNKIEISYNEDSAKVTRIAFQYKTIDILFNTEEESAETLVSILEREYDLPKMELRDMGFVKTWTCIDEDRNIKVTIDNKKNLRIFTYK